MKTVLKLSSWWGLSKKPGHKEMVIGEDGAYILKIIFSHPEHKADNTETKGSLTEIKWKEIQDFAKEKLTESKHNMVFDAGWAVEYFVGDKVIKVENDHDIWAKFMEMIPEYVGK